ncbi:MAG: zinc ribbon domain-containing protein [Thermoplasmata archaeon]
MFCRWCGTQLPDRVETCPKCGKRESRVSDSEDSGRDAVDRAVADTTRAARDLAAVAAQFSDRLATRMKAAADDPKGTATRTARRIAHDLDAARERIEKALQDL